MEQDGAAVKKDVAGKIFQHLTARQDEMVEMLKQLALLESPTPVAAAQQPVLDRIADVLRNIGMRCRRFAGTSFGDQLLALPRLPASRKRQLLLGHCDTVWPVGTLESMPVESKQGRLYGPGVYDMKGGLVQMIFALQTLFDLGIEPAVCPVVFVNSDEELGSQESAKRIRKLAQCVDRALVMEPSLGNDGRLKTERKGVGKFEIIVDGKAAHAGLDPEKGISAIVEMTHVVQYLHALNDPSSGTSVNVGIITGGTSPNVIAAQCSAKVDVRVRSQAIAQQIEKQIHNMQSKAPGTRIQVHGSFSRPPMEPTPGNRQIWNRARRAADILGIEIAEAAAGGGSDGNWTSLYTPTLDGMGAVGDGAHALHEHVIEDRMPQRSALLACLMLTGPLNIQGH